MYNNSEYRYQFEKYTGPSSRYTCPHCQKGKAYVRYVDAETNEHLPFEFGKCNRLSKCGYDNNPYTSGYAKEQWIAEKEKTSTTSTSKMNRAPQAISKPKPAKTCYLPIGLVKLSKRSNGNTFLTFLKGLVGDETTIQLIEQFEIGTSTHWEGATVFWLIDSNGRLRGGQVILFDDQGHTHKETRPDGSVKRYNGWVHYAIKAKLKRKGKPIPSWLTNYIEHGDKFPTLFGLHQLKHQPSQKPIAIVESAKTAIIATAYMPQFIWMAVGGLSYLNASRVNDLKGRDVVLFPDKGGYDNWQKKANEFDFLNITVSKLLELKNADAGSDIADYLTQFKPTREVQSIELNEHGYPASWDQVEKIKVKVVSTKVQNLIHRNPAIADMIEKFGLAISTKPI